MAASPPRKQKTVFLLGNGRSGTTFLCGLFQNNAADCTAVHEPYLGASRPAMFGLPIYDHTHGNLERLRETFERKLRGIRSYRTTWYVETTHAFLMSFADLAIEAFPDMKVVHVVRDPLRVCSSQAERERFIRRWRIPFRDYRGDNGRTYFRWGLTGDEPIFRRFADTDLSAFQRFAVQWIELENRAQRFLDRHDKRRDCFVLHTPGDLNNSAKIQSMFDFFGMRLKHRQVVLRGPRNVTPGAKTSHDQDQLRRELHEVISRLPDEYLETFQRPPYSEMAWQSLLQKPSAESLPLPR